MTLKSSTSKQNMKLKHKEVRKRSTPLAKDSTPLRFLCASLILVGILLSASLFYSGEASINGIQQIFHFTDKMFGSLEQGITGAMVETDKVEIEMLNDSEESVKERKIEKNNLPPVPAPVEELSVPETEARANLFGKAIFSRIGGSLSSYVIIGIISAFLLLTLSGGIAHHHRKSKYILTYPSTIKPELKSLPRNKVELLNQRIKELKKEVDKPQIKIIQKLPSREEVRRAASQRASPVPLRPTILETTSEKLKLDRELVDLQSRLSRLNQEQAKPLKVIGDISATPGIVREGEAEIREERKEFVGISTILLQSLKRPYLLLRAFFPRHKSQEELTAEEFARKEVLEISRKIEGNKPRPLNELIQLEQEIKNIREESFGLPEKAEQNKLKLLRELEQLEQELKETMNQK